MITTFSLIMVLPFSVLASDYHVGPGQTYTSVGAVPWNTLAGGDTVYIHWQATPYHEKLMISTRATSWPGLRVLGVVGTGGELPVIDGQNATTGPNMGWRSSWAAGQPYDIENLGVVSIVAGGATETNPAYVDLENLAIRNGRAGMSFTGENGTADTYQTFSAGIYAKNVQHLKIINCEISNAENGFFNSTGNVENGPNWWEGLASDILISGCYFHGNGTVGDEHEHTIYIQADRPVIEKNRFGPMAPGASGDQIKSRSAGDVIRYNYLEGEMGARFLDLVEEQDSGGTLLAKPYYGHDFVYGNIFVRTLNDANSGSGTIHWDGDHYGGGRATVANARLYFYDNTYVYNGVADAYDKEPIFSIQDAGDDCPAGTLTSQVDARNNIFYSMGASPKQLWWASCANTNVNLVNNWVSTPMAGDCSWAACSGTITGKSTNITPGGNPGFVDVASNDVHLTTGASALAHGAALAAEVTTNTLGIDLTPTEEYAYHQHTEPRSLSGNGADLGALQFGTRVAPNPPTQLSIAAP